MIIESKSKDYFLFLHVNFLFIFSAWHHRPTVDYLIIVLNFAHPYARLHSDTLPRYVNAFTVTWLSLICLAKYSTSPEVQGSQWGSNSLTMICHQKHHPK